MLEKVAESSVRTGFDVEIAAIATATPKHQVTQQDVTERAKIAAPHLESLWSLYSNTGIDTRYACEPAEWYLKEHGWEERTERFQHHALDLLEEVARKAVANAGIDLQAIDMIVTNTITGLAVPSLDAKLMNRLKLKPTVERLPIFGLGCGGGIGGMARATRLAQSMPGGYVLFLTVDLCSLCLRINDPSPAMFVSGALFGDGAAAVVLHNTSLSARDGSSGVPMRSITALGEICWPETEYIMGWDIKEDGFGIVLSPELPGFLRGALKPAVQSFLAQNEMQLQDFNGFIFHPGGRKLLETMEQVLKIDRSMLIHSWETLRHYGNMSSATVLFVLERALAHGARGPHLLGAFGPGFSAYLIAADL
jgi:alkylresorcinol/alkylpyrone synthase